MNKRLLEIKRSSLLCLLMLVGVSVPLSSVQAAFLTIDNPGFETEVIEDGAPTGWSLYDPPDLEQEIGSYNPTVTTDDGMGTVVTGDYEQPGLGNTIPPDGSNNVGYAWVYVGNTGPFASGEKKRHGIEQRLTGVDDVLKIGTYNLSVDVGNPQENDIDEYPLAGFGGYGIELLAGTCLDPTDEDESNRGGCIVGGATSLDSDAVTIGEGLFETVSLSIDVFGDNLLLDMALGVRLYNLNLDVPSGNNSSVDFDNVMLEYISPVPVPAAVWLFGSALLGLGGFNMRRKRAALKAAA